MKIKDIKCFLVRPRWVFVRIRTECGITGWGEASLPGRSLAVASLVDELGTYLTGRDPLGIENLWQELYRGGFFRGGPHHMSAQAGIDIALWDIKGKHHGAAVHALLGGACRDRIRTYAWIGGDRPIDVVDQLLERKDQGHTAVKMNACAEMNFVETHAEIDRVVGIFAKAKEAVGSGFDIALDFHGRVHRPTAKPLLHALDALKPMFIEEPVLPENMHALSNILQGLSTPIASGERCYHRSEFRPLFEGALIDIAQPDVANCGGITELRKIASFAEIYDIALAPHCPLGPIALAASLQVNAVAHNAFIQEQSAGMHYNKGHDLLDYITDPEVFSVKDGMLYIPQGPGLGIEINEDLVERESGQFTGWKNPVWRNKDGSIAEW